MTFMATRQGMSAWFLVVMTDISMEDAKIKIHEYQQELQKLGIKHEPSFAGDYVTISAGLVHVVPTGSDKLADAIRKADTALYMAKAGGRNQLFVYNDGEELVAS